MTVVTRKFLACPSRSASEAWTIIINTIAKNREDVKLLLESISGVAASIIADQTPETNPITVIGSGPRLRIYCLYGEDAVNGDCNESALSWELFETHWEMHFPVQKADLGWINKIFREKGNNFFVCEIGEKIKAINENSGYEPTQLTINIEKLKANG